MKRETSVVATRMIKRYLKRIDRNFKAIRKVRGKPSFEKIGKRCSLSYQTIRNIPNADGITLSTMVELSIALGCTVDDLLKEKMAPSGMGNE